MNKGTVDLLVKLGIVYVVWKLGFVDMIVQGIGSLAPANKPQGTNTTFG